MSKPFKNPWTRHIETRWKPFSPYWTGCSYTKCWPIPFGFQHKEGGLVEGGQSRWSFLGPGGGLLLNSLSSDFATTSTTTWKVTTRATKTITKTSMGIAPHPLTRLMLEAANCTAEDQVYAHIEIVVAVLVGNIFCFFCHNSAPSSRISMKFAGNASYQPPGPL